VPDDNPELGGLRERLERAEAAYAELLARLDALAELPVPALQLPKQGAQMARLNEVWSAPAPPEGKGFGAAFRRRAWSAFAPALERQTEFNAQLVRVLNGQLDVAGEPLAHVLAVAAKAVLEGDVDGVLGSP